ncbi:unnamed protein product [Agarophyton chilense]
MAEKIINDIEGWVGYRHRLFGRPQKKYLKVSGSTITIHPTPTGVIESYISAIGSTVIVSIIGRVMTLQVQSGYKYYLHFHNRFQCQEWATIIKNASIKVFEMHYEIGDQIGEGSFASVHKATRKSDGLLVAVKKVVKHQFDMVTYRELQREIYAMLNVQHGGIVKTYDVFNFPREAYFVLEFMPGGSLKDIVRKSGGSISEAAALQIARQVLLALVYLHENGYAHRDIKLENVLCETEDLDDTRVCLADFGYTNFFAEPGAECMRSLIGTPVYVAPEIFRERPYSEAVDMYAMGVMIFRMLCGEYPYDGGADNDKTKDLTIAGKLEFRQRAWKGVSIEAISLVKGLLQPNPRKRLTANGALQHSWFTNEGLHGMINDYGPPQLFRGSRDKPETPGNVHEDESTTVITRVAPVNSANIPQEPQSPRFLDLLARFKSTDEAHSAARKSDPQSIRELVAAESPVITNPIGSRFGDEYGMGVRRSYPKSANRINEHGGFDTTVHLPIYPRYSQPWRLDIEHLQSGMCEASLNGCTRTSGYSVLACAQPYSNEPSYPIPATARYVPNPFRGTTIYYNIPSVPEHLAEAQAPSHPLDGDAFVLALSFPRSDEGQIWIRGRFARTKPFLLEARARKRIYRGIYGTPSMKGWNAPLKPRASCLDCIINWGSQNRPRVLVMGPYALPLAIDGSTLVSKGPTALGGVLTDSQELVRERGTEVCCPPVRYGDTTVVLSFGRTSAGTITGAFLTEKGNTTKRYPRIVVPKGAKFTTLVVSDSFIVTAMCVTRTASSTFLSALMNKSARSEPPIVDLKEGTILTLFSRDGGGPIGSIRINGVMVTHLTRISDADGELTIRGLCLSSKESQPVISLNILPDSSCGNLWASEDPIGLRSDAFETVISLHDIKKRKRKTLSKNNLSFPFFHEDVMLVDPGTFANSKMVKTQFQCVYTAYDLSRLRAGVKILDDRSSSERTWLTSSRDDRLSGVIMDQDGSHVAVLRTSYGRASAGGELLLFDTSTIEDGPVTTIELDKEKFGVLLSAVGGVWAPHSIEWSEEGSKPVKSAYEIFDSRGWNDIDSSFSSLGINQ